VGQNCEIDTSGQKTLDTEDKDPTNHGHERRGGGDAVFGAVPTIAVNRSVVAASLQYHHDIVAEALCMNFRAGF